MKRIKVGKFLIGALIGSSIPSFMIGSWIGAEVSLPFICVAIIGMFIAGYKGGKGKGWGDAREEFEGYSNEMKWYRKGAAKMKSDIQGWLEWRLTDDAIVGEYYHGYIQAMIDDLKECSFEDYRNDAM